MPKQRIYNSNAEKQRAYRLRKKLNGNKKEENSNDVTNKKVTKRIIQPEIIDDGPGFVAGFDFEK